MSHTPGPWYAQRDPHAIMTDDWCIGAAGQIDAVAVCSEQDAHLIAAAPDLLEALEGIMQSVAGCQKESHWDVARAAIAKARGEI